MKSKKLKNVILAIIFTIITTITTHSIADVGSFESYDSGSSWSSSSSDYGSSSWSSSDYGSSWSDHDYGRGSYSHSSGSSEWDFFDLFIAVIILMIVLYITFRKGKSDQKYQRPVIHKDKDYIGYVDEIVIENKIKSIDANFNKEEFISWAKDIFVQLQMAWTKRDWEEIRLYETNELFEQHKTQLQGYINNGTINVMDRICVNYAKLNRFEQTADKDILSIALNSSMIDYIKDEKTGAVLKGNTENRLTNTYRLTFIRKKGVLTQAGGPKVASANCPNCGAPTKVALAGKCEYCGSIIKIEDHGWVLSNLERM